MSEKAKLAARLQDCEHKLNELQSGMSLELKKKGRLSRKQKRFSVNFLLGKWKELLQDVFFSVGNVPYDWHAMKLVREEVDGETEFMLLLTGGKFFVLTKLLPEGVKVRNGDAFFYINFKRTVCYNPSWLDYRGFVWALLHEFGHARAGTPISDVPPLLAEHFLLDYFGSVCTRKFLKKMWKFKERSEREASKYALQELVRLEEMGFPVLGSQEGEDIASKFFDLALVTHMRKHLQARANSNADVSNLFDDLFVTGKIQLSFFSSRIQM